MTYTLITANRNYSSWSLRPWVLMKALNLPFEDRIEPFAAASNYAAFRSFSPTGQVPALIDGDRIVWDSLGITLYLADRHAGVWPADEAARAFAQCAVALGRDIARLRELWEEGLDRFGGPFLAGSVFTAIDAFYAPVAFRVRTYGLDVGPAGQSWVDHMLAHPAMKQWEDEALAESWREESHEAEIGAAGRIIADYRAA